MAKLNKEEQETINLLIKRIREILPNVALQDKLFMDIDRVYSDSTELLSITENSIKFSDRFKGTFEIVITPTSIVETFKNNTGNHLSQTIVEFNDTYVSVKKDSIIGEKSSKTMPKEILRRTEITDYKNNEVIHEKSLMTVITTGLDNPDSYSAETEKYISSSRIAYIRNMVIDNNGTSEVTYQKCCSYNPTPFNDIDNPRQVEEPFIYDTNENEFITSVEEIKRAK